MRKSELQCKNNIDKALKSLYDDSEELLYFKREVPVVLQSATRAESWPLQFYRDHVSRNFPLLIRGGANDLPAVGKWNSNYFRQHFPDKEVEVTLTPNGYADGISNYHGEDYLFLPEELPMKFNEFLDILEKKQENCVSYIQQQNSNLTENFPELLPDVTSEFEWASVAFDSKPDAVNFWMGDERAISSMHKDPYENIYCVIDGHKDFILIPPLDLPYVPYKKYPVRKYKNVTPGGFQVESVRLEDSRSWIAVDPLNETPADDVHQDFYTKARRFHVRVEKGDVLYLPGLWFHHVRQSHGCVAVNFWYDMDYYNPRYSWFRMLACLCDKDQHIN